MPTIPADLAPFFKNPILNHSACPAPAATRSSHTTSDIHYAGPPRNWHAATLDNITTRCYIATRSHLSGFIYPHKALVTKYWYRHYTTSENERRQQARHRAMAFAIAVHQGQNGLDVRALLAARMAR